MPHNSLKAMSVPDSKTNIAFSANGIHISCVSEEYILRYRIHTDNIVVHTDSTMANETSTKGQTTIYKTYI
jgi:hypothetical protein